MAKRARLINSFDEDEDEDSTSNKGLTNEDFKNLYNTKTTQEDDNNNNNNNNDKDNNDEEIDFGVLIVEFSQLTGEEDHSKILAILEKHNWKLETAVTSFLDDQDSSYYYQSTPSNYNTTNQDPNYNSSTTNTTPPQSSYESSYDAVAYHNYQKFYNSNSGRDDESDGEDDRSQFTNVTFADPTVMPKIIVDDQDDTSSMFVNPDTSRHDVSSDDEDDRDEAYYKSRSKYGDSLQMSDVGNSSTSDSKYIQPDDFSAFSTIEDHVSNSRQNEQNEYYYDDDNNNNNNNNNNNTFTSTTTTTTTTTTTSNDWANLSFNSFQNKCTVSDINNNEQNIGDLDYNTRYYCKLATQGSLSSGWEPKPPLQRGRVSLKLLCVEKLTGLIITHEKLIELLKLSEYIDVYAYHELVFGTAAQCYFTIRSLPSFKTLSDTTVTRIQDFM